MPATRGSRSGRARFRDNPTEAGRSVDQAAAADNTLDVGFEGDKGVELPVVADLAAANSSGSGWCGRVSYDQAPQKPATEIEGETRRLS